MLDSGRYSDLTITCGSKVFRVHRNVVCLQSKPLAAHVDGVFVVSAFTSLG
ncbi:BTB POZ domain protein [Rutstroemia sp. NJR-2017a BVV2]|nr:BTB POZ domain protein [Rutstroemia sp. NJR-2017a BVV2]